MENAVKYKGLVATLTREILGGKFVPLGAFPSERALAQRFGVARQTVRNAMRELIRRGLVYSRQGQGTFLTRGGFYSVNHIHSITTKLWNILERGKFALTMPQICLILSVLAFHGNAKPRKRRNNTA